MSIEVLKSGLLTTLQDLGRVGYAHLGVGRAGAFDKPALRLANALCGNAPDACGLEITLLGPTLRVCNGGWIAVTGAAAPLLVDEQERPTWAPVFAPANAVVTLGGMRSGCRSYLAVGGGFDVRPVLGSRSTDVNAGLGPTAGQPLRAGNILSVRDTHGAPATDPSTGRRWWLDPAPWFDADRDPSLRLLPGTHVENMTKMSRNLLFSNSFEVDTDSNRAGLRLLGPKLEWTHPIEIVSEGCVPGVLQLPPAGQPIAFGVECPVSGGYPRIGQIAAVDMPRLAQRRPGDAVRFRRCSLEQAWHALRTRERALSLLEANIRTRLDARD
jgi:antagonist of KipI